MINHSSWLRTRLLMFSLKRIESQHNLRWCWSIWTKQFNTTIFLDKYCEKLVFSFCSKPILVSIMQLGMLRYILVCTWFWSIQGANILFIHPLFAGSHLGLLLTIGKNLNCNVDWIIHLHLNLQQGSTWWVEAIMWPLSHLSKLILLWRTQQPIRFKFRFWINGKFVATTLMKKVRKEMFPKICT